MYFHRDRNGILKSKIRKREALDIINHTSGHFRSYQALGKDKLTAFEIDEDSKWGNATIELFLWKGDILVPE